MISVFDSSGMSVIVQISHVYKPHLVLLFCVVLFCVICA